MDSETPASLHCYMNWLALDGLPELPSGPVNAIRDAGFDGIQFVDPIDHAALDEARKIGLRVCGSGRANEPADAERLAAEARADGLECLTLHLGWGIEDDTEAARLIDSVLNASAKHALPLYPETHRATIFQDMWRTVQFARRFPQLRFNGDFSHWYTGSEMVYGGFEKKVEFILSLIHILGRAAREDRVLDQHSFGRADGEGGTVRLSLWNHPTDTIYGTVARSESIVGSAEKLLGGEVYHYHSKMIMKDAKVGGAWTWHQDYGYWYQNGVLFPLLTSASIAVDRANRENGCLQVIKGSHELGRIEHVLTGEQAGADQERVNEILKKLEVVYVEMEPGDTVFFLSLIHI